MDPRHAGIAQPVGLEALSRLELLRPHGRGAHPVEPEAPDVPARPVPRVHVPVRQLPLEPVWLYGVGNDGFLADLQVWGTPEQVTERLLDYVKRTDAGGLVVPLCFGGMPADEATANFELFAAKVLPELRRHDVGGDLGVTYDTASAVVA